MLIKSFVGVLGMKNYQKAYESLNAVLSDQENEAIKTTGSSFLIEVEQLAHQANEINRISIDQLTKILNQLAHLLLSTEANDAAEFEKSLDAIKRSQNTLKRSIWGQDLNLSLLELVSAIIGTLSIEEEPEASDSLITDLQESLYYLTNPNKIAELLDNLIESVMMKKPPTGRLVH